MQDVDSLFAAKELSMYLASIVSVLLTVLVIAAIWTIYRKAGEPGWASIVPFYNTYILFKITWGNGWKFLLLLIPVVNVIISIMVSIKLAQAFGKGGGFAVGLIFLPFVFIPVLALGDSEYIGST